MFCINSQFADKVKKKNKQKKLMIDDEENSVSNRLCKKLLKNMPQNYPPPPIFSSYVGHAFDFRLHFLKANLCKNTICVLRCTIQATKPK